MFAGPNGAGKSSIYEASNKGVQQVNADVIQKENPDYTQGRAGIEAGRRIEELLKEKATFSTENNLYKKSNLNTITRYQEAGYRVEVTYVSLESAELCKKRVDQRVANGGHPIPDKQISERYYGGLATIRDHYQVPDKLTLLDNSGSDREANRRPLLTIEQGKIVQEAPDLPKWVAEIKDHIRHLEKESQVPGREQVPAGPTPQQAQAQYLANVGPVAQGLKDHGDPTNAARLQEVARFVERVPYLGGSNRENVEKALAAADQVPALRSSKELGELKGAANVMSQMPTQERSAGAGQRSQEGGGIER